MRNQLVALCAPVHGRLGLAFGPYQPRPSAITKSQHLVMAALGAWHKIIALVTFTPGELDSADALDRRRGSHDDFFVMGELRGPLNGETNWISFRSRACGIAIDLIQQRIADRPHREAEGEIAPVNVMCPTPFVNTLCSVVLLESRDFTGEIFPRSAGVLRNIGATRSFDSALASSVRGSTTSTGPGSTSAMKPKKFSRHSLFIN